MTVLVGKEKITGSVFASAVPTKGSSGMFIVDKAVEFVEETGDSNNTILLKTDQETSIKYFVKDFIGARVEGKTIPEESPVGSSGSNGRVERGVQSIEGQLRALLLAFEGRIGRRLDVQEKIVMFMPEYAACLINRLDVGKDGKTSYERTKGKKATLLGIEFGEKLLYKVKKDAKLAKARERWEYAIFVGIKRRSGEVWLAADGKIFSARSVRRIPVLERWCEDCVKWVTRAPWSRYKDAPAADEDLPEDLVMEARPLLGEMRGPTIINTKAKAPREFYIKKEDAEKHGYTRGCGGCSSWFRGLGRQPHSEKCRERFREIMKEDAKVKNAEERKRDFVEKIEERKKRKTEKKAEKDKEDAEMSGAIEQDGGRAQAGRSESSGSQAVAGGQGETRKAEDGDDIDAERLVGGVEVIDEEFAEVCINEVAKMMKKLKMLMRRTIGWAGLESK